MNTKIPILYTIILYICAFVLFLEWLYPINVVGDVNNLTVFILFTLFCFFISILQLHWLLSMSLKGIGLIFIIDSLFLTGTPLSKPWVTQLFTEIGYNLNALFSEQWYELTPLFRSVLFLILIWLMSYLLQYWFIVMKRIFLFILLTFIYLTVLDTFTVYDADMAIVRTFVVSFIALGMTSLFKEIDQEEIRFSWMKKQTVWIVPLVLVVMFSTLVGYAAPKFDPQWPDPVPFIKSAADNAGGPGDGSSVIQKVGYGNDDTRLGGSFVQDNTPVFQAVAEDKNYWRVETKDIYTGKGWVKSQNLSYSRQNPDNFALETFADSVETEEFEAEVNFQGDSGMEKLIYPYGIEEVTAEKDDVNYLLESGSGEIRTEIDDEGVKLNHYSIMYDKPTFAINKLRNASMEDPSFIDERYTQLPDSLPGRVGDLAKQITSDKDNRYDKAQAVESYFNSNGFVYQTTNVPIPDKGEDYVAQFLFDSKAGYCDNFSTSMVVLLRTLDIPARWVKGFTGGEQVGSTDNGKNVYEITNSNAHSWVEVYFPEIGWVPFEPTQGFSNLSDFELNLDNETATRGTEQSTGSDSQQQQQQRQPEPIGPQQQQNDAGTSAGNSTAGSNVNWWSVLLISAVVLLAAYIIYRTRLHWQTLFVMLKYNSKSDAKTYQEAYHLLLKVLEKNGLSKKPDQTLREYSQRIDYRFQTDAMGRLTSHYERILYKNETDNKEAAELNQLWKYLIKRVKA
ncbi:transglutaminase TgpA family protein [Virgibacillus ihumii]|uniref:transglutaminase TgpA family protein n=1 Tax=Virgibacillus ihumii TaxID=2686091 RepID=UPI00157DD766|nr:transglutaminaseTgpA domain-containing protein [Virgibacillus ihumii]